MNKKSNLKNHNNRDITTTHNTLQTHRGQRHIREDRLLLFFVFHLVIYGRIDDGTYSDFYVKMYESCSKFRAVRCEIVAQRELDNGG